MPQAAAVEVAAGSEVGGLSAAGFAGCTESGAEAAFAAEEAGAEGDEDWDWVWRGIWRLGGWKRGVEEMLGDAGEGLGVMEGEG